MNFDTRSPRERGAARIRYLIAAFSCNPIPLEVDLSGSAVVSDEDLARLSKMKGFRYVVMLNLADTRITDRGIEPFVNHTDDLA